MLIVFSNIQGIVHNEYVPPGQTVNGKFYCEVLKRLREDIRHKHPDKWKKNNWFLHHDKAPAHTSLVVWQFLTSKNITVIPHPPTCLTLPPANFSYSPRWNYGWKGVVLTRLRRSTQKRKSLLTLTFENFQGCMKSWETSWNRCIHDQVGYFEGDGGN